MELLDYVLSVLVSLNSSGKRPVRVLLVADDLGVAVLGVLKDGRLPVSQGQLEVGARPCIGVSHVINSVRARLQAQELERHRLLSYHGARDSQHGPAGGRDPVLFDLRFAQGPFPGANHEGHAEEIESRTEEQFGTTFVVRTYSLGATGEAVRFDESIDMPPAEVFSFDARLGGDRLGERARVFASLAVDRLDLYWSSRAR